MILYEVFGQFFLLVYMGRTDIFDKGNGKSALTQFRKQITFVPLLFEIKFPICDSCRSKLMSSSRSNYRIYSTIFCKVQSSVHTMIKILEGKTIGNPACSCSSAAWRVVGLVARAAAILAVSLAWIAGVYIVWRQGILFFCLNTSYIKKKISIKQC